MCGSKRGHQVLSGEHEHTGDEHHRVQPEQHRDRLHAGAGGDQRHAGGKCLEGDDAELRARLAAALVLGASLVALAACDRAPEAPAEPDAPADAPAPSAPAEPDLDETPDLQALALTGNATAVSSTAMSITGDADFDGAAIRFNEGIELVTAPERISPASLAPASAQARLRACLEAIGARVGDRLRQPPRQLAGEIRPEKANARRTPAIIPGNSRAEPLYRRRHPALSVRRRARCT